MKHGAISGSRWDFLGNARWAVLAEGAAIWGSRWDFLGSARLPQVSTTGWLEPNLLPSRRSNYVACEFKQTTTSSKLVNLKSFSTFQAQT